MTTDIWTHAVRLLAATAIGCVLGLTRDVTGKPAGMRTMGLVALGAALITLAGLEAAHGFDHDALSRVMQGIIQGVMAGVGFIGAGAVLHNPEHMRVRGLTTAAIIWSAAALGVACGLGAWMTVAFAAGLALILIVVLHPIEKRIERMARAPKKDGEAAD